MRLRGVFNHGYSILISNCVDAVQIRRHTIKVYRGNSFCARCDCGFKLGWAHRPTRTIDIYKNRGRADVADRPRGRDERHSDGYHFISRPDIETTECKVERTCTTVQTHAMIHATVCCEFLLKFRRRRSLSKMSGFANLLHRGQDFVSNASILSRKVEVRHSYHIVRFVLVLVCPHLLNMSKAATVA